MVILMVSSMSEITPHPRSSAGIVLECIVRTRHIKTSLYDRATYVLATPNGGGSVAGEL